MEEHELIPAHEFCSHHHVELDFIYSLQEYGLIEVINNEGTNYFSPESLNELEKIVRLHYDLNVNMEGIDVILHLLKQLENAQQEMNELRNQLKFYR
jgi:DNA-binding transcriptional MerR regulator